MNHSHLYSFKQGEKYSKQLRNGGNNMGGLASCQGKTQCNLFQTVLDSFYHKEFHKLGRLSNLKFFGQANNKGILKIYSYILLKSLHSLPNTLKDKQRTKESNQQRLNKLKLLLLDDQLSSLLSQNQDNHEQQQQFKHILMQFFNYLDEILRKQRKKYEEHLQWALQHNKNILELISIYLRAFLQKYHLKESQVDGQSQNLRHILRILSEYFSLEFYYQEKCLYFSQLHMLVYINQEEILIGTFQNPIKLQKLKLLNLEITKHIEHNRLVNRKMYDTLKIKVPLKNIRQSGQISTPTFPKKSLNFGQNKNKVPQYQYQQQFSKIINDTSLEGIQEENSQKEGKADLKKVFSFQNERLEQESQMRNTVKNNSFSQKNIHLSNKNHVNPQNISLVNNNFVASNHILKNKTSDIKSSQSNFNKKANNTISQAKIQNKYKEKSQKMFTFNVNIHNYNREQQIHCIENEETVSCKCILSKKTKIKLISNTFQVIIKNFDKTQSISTCKSLTLKAIKSLDNKIKQQQNSSKFIIKVSQPKTKEEKVAIMSPSMLLQKKLQKIPNFIKNLKKRQGTDHSNSNSHSSNSKSKSYDKIKSDNKSKMKKKVYTNIVGIHSVILNHKDTHFPPSRSKSRQKSLKNPFKLYREPQDNMNIYHLKTVDNKSFGKANHSPLINQPQLIQKKFKCSQKSPRYIDYQRNIQKTQEYQRLWKQHWSRAQVSIYNSNNNEYSTINKEKPKPLGIKKMKSETKSYYNQ